MECKLIPMSLFFIQMISKYFYLHDESHTCLTRSMSPFSAYAFNNAKYVSGPGSIPASFITVRIFSAFSLSLELIKEKRIDYYNTAQCNIIIQPKMYYPILIKIKNSYEPFRPISKGHQKRPNTN